MQHPPAPLEWHPAYRDHADALLPYVNGHGPDVIQWPINRPMTIDDQTYPTSPAPQPLTLTRQKAAGPAPFIGDARYETGWYEWWVATDTLGRAIAGESRLIVVPHPPR
jgi:hypothetical protein